MRVLAINDLSCIGKCSLTVALPVISACGSTCDPLPTAMLSTHTGGFIGYTFLDLTDEMDKIVAHWETLPVRYDIIYSGYLGSIAQIDKVKKIKDALLKKDGVFVVDPVMGDNGKLYGNFNEAYVQKMRSLCAEADYLLPNPTEACFLSGKDFKEDLSPAEIDGLFSALSGKKTNVVLTGIKRGNEIAVLSEIKGKRFEARTNFVEGSFHGAGDVFASAFVGLLGKGMSPEKAVEKSANYTTRAIERTKEKGGEAKYGMEFEAEIPYLIL